MNVLLVASTDSYNAVLPVIGQALVNKGHDVVVLKTETGEAHHHIFAGTDFIIKEWHQFDSYDDFEVAVYGNIFNKQVLDNLINRKILCVGLFFHLTIDDYVLGGANLHADYTLCFGNRFIENQYRLGVKHNFLPVGVPYELTVSKSEPKTLLFLEQHFFPSGDKGKKQLADFLVSIVKKTDYKVIVKPRSLPNEENTHHKADHLYNYFDVIPDNLILLREHQDLHKLTEQASIVATTFSTAIVPALVMNKPVVFVTGFAFEESYYYNQSLIQRYYALYKNTGNIFHFRDVIPHLDEIKTLPFDKCNYLIHPRASGFAQSIVKFLEFIQSSPLLAMKGLNIDNFYTANQTIVRKPQDYFNNVALEKIYRANIVSGFRMHEEVKQLQNFISNYNTSKCALDEYKSKLTTKCNELITSGTERVFQSYKRHPIGFKGVYLKYLYDNGKHEECKNLPKSWRIADYYYNLYLFARGNRGKSEVTFLKRYLKLVEKAKYRYTPLYEDKFIKRAKTILQEQHGEVL